MEQRQFTEKDYREARLISVHAHGNQTYGDLFPYEKHLQDVVDILIRFGFSGKYIIAAWLHDIIEDTAISYNKIKRQYGLEVAEMVYGVTDELGRNRAEKKAKTLPKTASIPGSPVLKVADRIANIEMGGKVDMYVNEFDEFKTALFASLPADALPMWDHLETLLKIQPVTV